jgi:capsular exopolysaccharide synthesis family protein
MYLQPLKRGNMSRIFDALQRSEAEGSGIDLSTLSGVAELLQCAEREAVSKWNAAARSERPTVPQRAQRAAALGLQAVAPIAPAVDPEAQGELSALDEELDMFSLFQSKQVSLSPESRLVCITDKDSPAAEAFRLLAVRLRQLRRSRSLQKVLITSTVPEEGKSLVSANLACTLALRTEQRVLLLEGDVRRPSLSRIFGLAKNTGICEWLQGDCGLTMSIYHLEGPNLWILPAGNAPSNPLELVQSGRLSALMDKITACFDWIIIDSPPVPPLADTSIWTQFADGILLVTRQGTTQKRRLQRGLDTLEAKKLIGAVLNCSKNPDHSSYYYRTPAVQSASDGSSDHI